MKTKRIICLYGGPGAGKSTICAGLFYKLKMEGYNCEMNREYIKEWVWEDRGVKDGDQAYFFSKQARRERIYMANELDFIITDSPLILTHYYGMKYDVYEQKYNTSLAMLHHHHGVCQDNGYKVEHIFIQRAKEYNPAGRFQDEETAKSFDIEIKALLSSKDIKYEEVLANGEGVDKIIEILNNKQ